MEHSKGKSVNTSVPTIAVRFNATAEEIEELYQSEEDISEPTNSEQTRSTGDLESSPLRYLPRLGKRSASTDNTLTAQDSSPTSDPWKFFTDIKGKITKNIEDKITEIKQRNEEGDTAAKKQKDSKDNCSDSEDISESSISKTCGVASTTEGVEMSTDEESSSLEKDKKLEDNAQLEQQSTDVMSTASPSFRQRVKIIKKGSDEYDSKESLVTLNTLGKLIELQTGINPSSRQILNESGEVESGIEALEEGLFQNENQESNLEEEDILPEELIANVAEKIDNLDVDDDHTIIIQPVTGEDIKKSFAQQDDTRVYSYYAPEGFVDLRGKYFQRKTIFDLLHSFKRFMIVVCFIILYIYGPLPVYFSGFIAGILVTVTVVVVSLTFFSPNIYMTGYTKQPIITPTELVSTVPEIKEHLPISTYEGWMNEYPDEYNPLTYHISQTQSVYIKLQGNLLRISHTRAKIPKRAMWDEPKHKLLFTQHRIYNLLDAKVLLLPEGLHKKRHWSKKYPICIILNNDQLNFESKDNILVGLQPSNHSGNSEKKENLKSKEKKKGNVEPQIYSKLNEENLLESPGSPEGLTELEPHELDSLGMKLNENLLEDEDYLSHNLLEEEHAEEDTGEIDDWTTFSQWESPTETHLYLFGRTGREKEDWFRRFITATHKGSNVSCESPKTETETDEVISETLIKASHSEAEYLKYMSQFIKAKKRKKGQIREDEYLRAVNVLWLNAVIGRVLYDWSKDHGFTNALKDKIHKKLMTIKLPYFIEQLNVHELSLGNSSPLIHNAHQPVLDQRGLWVDLDMSYQGNIVLTLQTKLNLMKLKSPHYSSNDTASNDLSAKWQSSDVEDTAESSTDDEGHASSLQKPSDDKSLPVQSAPNIKSTKLMRVVDKITESRIFQAATDNRYIKKAMEGVSNTDLSLKVEVKGLIGTLVLNIPPPPSDRLWIGFRPAPKMFLTAQPMVGVRNMSFIKYLTNWIEKKLCKEFQKLMVIPNMEDFSIPNMSSELPK